MANLPRSRAIGRVTDGAAVRRQHTSIRMVVLAVVGRAPIVMGRMHREVLIYYEYVLFVLIGSRRQSG